MYMLLIIQLLLVWAFYLPIKWTGLSLSLTLISSVLVFIINLFMHIQLPLPQYYGLVALGIVIQASATHSVTYVINRNKDK